MKFKSLYVKDYLRVLKIERNKFIMCFSVVFFFLLVLLGFIGFMSYYISYTFLINSMGDNILYICFTLGLSMSLLIIIYLYIYEKGLKYYLLKDKEILGIRKILMNKKTYKKVIRTHEGFKYKKMYVFVFNINGESAEFYVNKNIYRKKKIGDSILIVKYNLCETINLNKYSLY